MTRTAREHEMFRPRDAVLVCVSGGPDSVCLLYSLWHLRRLFRIRLEVFHYDHRLRPDSGSDAGYVARVGERLRLPVHVRVADETPAKGASIEAWATMARTAAADRVCEQIGARVIAEGHTLDDQAETVLLNLIRGGGLEALGGIWPGGSADGGADHVQPLLDVERTEVEAFCRALHLRPRIDPTNRDPRNLRNAIRHQVLPAIERATRRDVRRPIARSADLLRQDRAELDGAAIDAIPAVLSDREGELRLDVAALLSLPPPVAARVVRLATYRLLGPDDAAPWGRGSVEAVLDLAEGRPGRRRDLANGSTARREREYVSLSRTSPESRE
ncbi:MAG: tRNA lysidine(34) synthetase TilS [Actinomycetota bacterium]